MCWFDVSNIPSHRIICSRNISVHHNYTLLDFVMFFVPYFMVTVTQFNNNAHAGMRTKLQECFVLSTIPLLSAYRLNTYLHMYVQPNQSNGIAHLFIHAFSILS